MNKIKEMLKKISDISYIGIADISGNIISSVFWFYIASLVNVEEYGKITYFLAISTLISTISLVGSSNFLMVKIPKAIRIESSIYAITSILGVISSIVLYFVFHQIELSILTLGFIIFSLATSELLGLKMYKKYLQYVIIQKISMMALGIFLFYRFGITGVLLGIGISYFPYLIRILKIIKKGKIDISLIKIHSKFWINSYVLDLSNTFIASVDKIIVGPFFGYLILGYYQLGNQFLNVLYIMPGIAFKYLITQESGGNSTGVMKWFVILLATIITILGIFVSPIILPILFPKYEQTIQTLQILSFAVVPYTINSIFHSKFLSNERVKIVLSSSGVFLSVHISTIIILGNLYGVNGIAVSIVLSELAQLSYYFVFSKIKSSDNI